MWRILAIIALSVVLLGQASPALAAPRWWPLVPCGLNQIPKDKTEADGYTLPCNQCDILRLIKNLIDFFLFGVTPVLATLFFIYAGLKIVVGGAMPAQLAAGQKIFWDTIKALAGILIVWLAINTVLKSVGNPEILPTEWWKLECTYTPPSSTPKPSGSVTPAPTGGQVPADVKSAASELLGSGVSFSTSADCGSPYHASQNIRDMANGTLPAVCSVSCNCAPNGTVVNAGLLRGLTTLKNAGFGFTVTSFLTGKHSGGSSHYSGRAVDIVPVGDKTRWQQAKDKLNSIGGSAICENTAGASVECSVAGVDHIHWTYP
ncbi:MAG: hypothetical protein AAB561_00010 [Patescibacteria group bacterium]